MSNLSEYIEKVKEYKKKNQNKNCMAVERKNGTDIYIYSVEKIDIAK